MARAASKDTVAADMRPTDYRGAVKRLETIDNKATKQQKIAKEIGDVYSAIEQFCGVNKLAGKIWRSLKKLEGPERLEVFRDLNGLIDAAGWEREGGDMVDQAQNNVVKFGFPGGDGQDDGDDGEPGDELNPEEQPTDADGFEMPPEELAQQEGRGRLNKARERAKGAAAAAAEAPPAPPADDSDLADAGE